VKDLLSGQEQLNQGLGWVHVIIFNRCTVPGEMTSGAPELGYNLYWREKIPVMKTGDVIMYRGLTSLSGAITAVSNSPYSHVGLVVRLTNEQFESGMYKTFDLDAYLTEWETKQKALTEKKEKQKKAAEESGEKKDKEAKKEEKEEEEQLKVVQEGEEGVKDAVVDLPGSSAEEKAESTYKYFVIESTKNPDGCKDAVNPGQEGNGVTVFDLAERISKYKGTGVCYCELKESLKVHEQKSMMGWVLKAHKDRVPFEGVGKAIEDLLEINNVKSKVDRDVAVKELFCSELVGHALSLAGRAPPDLVASAVRPVDVANMQSLHVPTLLRYRLAKKK